MAHASPPNSPRSRAGVLSGRQEPQFGRASSRAGALSRAPQGAGLRAGRRRPRLRTGQRRPPRPLPAGGFSGQRLPGPALTDRPTSWAAPIMGSGGARGPTMRKGLSLSGAALLLLLLPAATAQQSPGAGEDRGGRSGPEEAGWGGARRPRWGEAGDGAPRREVVTTRGRRPSPPRATVCGAASGVTQVSVSRSGRRRGPWRARPALCLGLASAAAQRGCGRWSRPAGPAGWAWLSTLPSLGPQRDPRPSRRQLALRLRCRVGK